MALSPLGLSAISVAREEDEVDRVIEQISRSDNSKPLEAAFIQKYMRLATSEQFLIERSWSKEYTLYLKGTQPRMRPVDNTPLVGDHNVLLPHLLEKAHYHSVPAEVWRLLMHLYGGGPAVRATLPAIPQKPPVCGLKNTLFNCYLNAGLQFVLSIPEFVRYFRERAYRLAKNSRLKVYSAETEGVIQGMELRDKGAAAGLARLLEGRFGRAEQQDCQEFLRYYLG